VLNAFAFNDHCTCWQGWNSLRRRKRILSMETEGEEREENSTERQLRDSDTNGCIPTNEGGVLGADSQYRVFLHLY
jgi:hypothetical protein